ncbi:hypothetical protein CXP39_03225 [Mesoplasma syrphidae]|uniref:Uncharacterized protein n=1 Tax=Mesoplasma syrphidae TaxID=225999 RepID=A0A2K9C670_9MOLU|nr:hypothetical protein CXP39_03225 [Mesoplasma syrphidae]
MPKCSKCSIENVGLINISVGTEDLYIKTEMVLCWKCFKKEYRKHDTKNVYIFKREEKKSLNKKKA